jgi:DNA-binding NtrC family response regulator
LALSSSGTYEFIFVDLHLLEIEKEQLGEKCYQASLQILWNSFSEAKIIVIAGEQNIRSVVRAVRAGADDYLMLPIEKVELELIIEKANESAIQAAQIRHLEKMVSEKNPGSMVQTSSDPMTEVFGKVNSVADKKANVLLTGETGVGKGVIARLIHEQSSRRSGPFIAVHCGAIPENLIESELFGHEKGAFTGAIKRKLGRFELANGGTIFLDEIGTVSPSTQIKLLQVLQESIFHRVGGEEDIHVDIRIISATNENLVELSDRGEFRKDLFYRLNVFPIHIPPLRERIEDLNELMTHFVKKFSRMHSREISGIRPEVLESLSKYSWPGNIRELENLIERACIIETSSALSLGSFPVEVSGKETSEQIVAIDSHLPLAEARTRVLENFEKKYLIELMTEHKGSIKEVAKASQVGVRQIHKLLAKYELLGRNFRKVSSKLAGEVGKLSFH